MFVIWMSLSKKARQAQKAAPQQVPSERRRPVGIASVQLPGKLGELLYARMAQRHLIYHKRTMRHGGLPMHVTAYSDVFSIRCQTRHR